LLDSASRFNSIPLHRQQVVDLALQRRPLFYQQIPRLGQMHQFPVLFRLHPYLRQQVLFQIQRQCGGIPAVRLLDRLADYLELVRVDHHHSAYSVHYRIVKARCRPHRFHSDLVLLAQLFHELW